MSPRMTCTSCKIPRLCFLLGWASFANTRPITYLYLPFCLAECVNLSTNTMLVTLVSSQVFPLPRAFFSPRAIIKPHHTPANYTRRY